MLAVWLIMASATVPINSALIARTTHWTHHQLLPPRAFANHYKFVLCSQINYYISKPNLLIIVMLSSTYITLVLAASAAAAPAFSGLGPAAGFGAPSYITSSGSQSQSADAAGSSYNSSPFGTSASQYSSHQASASSYSNTQVIGAFNGIYSQLAQMQSLLAGGSLSYQAAQQQMAQLASQFQGAFSQFPGCASCFSAGSGLNSVLSSLFSQYASTMSAYQSAFGNQFSSLVSPLASMSSQFSSFFQSYASQSSSSINTILPSGFGNILGSTVPGALPTLGSLGYK